MIFIREMRSFFTSYQIKKKKKEGRKERKKERKNLVCYGWNAR